MAESVEGSPAVSKRTNDAGEESERSSLGVSDTSKLLIKRSFSTWISLRFIPRLKESSNKKKPTISPLSFLQKHDEFSEILKGIYQFTFEDIRAATNDFNDRNVIEKGYFKTTYKGFLPPHNQIALRLFNVSEGFEHPDNLRNDAYVSSRLYHRNIENLLGYCNHNDKFMLIYKYEQNGSLDRLLFTGEDEKEKLLNWRIRYKFCLEIANGLAYLHKERIIHRNIKPSKILLDTDFVPKIDDFFLAKHIREDVTCLSTHLVGTRGYIDMEYLVTGLISEKTDVFSYGVVILEIVSGKKVKIYTEHGTKYQVYQLHNSLKQQGNLLEFVDPRLGSDYSEEEALTLLKLSALCTKIPSSFRPSISTVVSILEGKLKVEELIHEQWEVDYYEPRHSSSLFSGESEIDDVETSDDGCTTPPMSEVNTMIPSKENDVVTQEINEPMEPSNETQTCEHEFESTMTPAQVVENCSLKVPHPLTKKVEQQTPSSLTTTTSCDTTFESIKNTNDDSSCDGISILDDDFHHLHVASGDPLHNTDDIDTLISVIDAIRIPEDPNGLRETPSSSSSVPTAEVVVAFDRLKNIVLRNNLREALDEETKSKILHLCEILDGFDHSETQSGLVRRVKELLAFASEFSGIQEEDSLYKKMYESAKLKIEETKDKANKLHHEAATLRASKTSAESDIDNIMNRKAKLHEELAKLDEQLSAVKMRQVHDEKKLVEIHKVLASDTREITLLAQSLATADRRIKNNKECLENAQEDWKQIQAGFW